MKRIRLINKSNKRFSEERIIGKINNIKKVAAILFNKKGYLETTMDDIAQKAKLSKGAIYYYFSSKTEILYYISINYMNLLLENLEEELKKETDPYSKINLIITRHIKIFTKYTYEAKTTLHEARLLPPKYFKKYAKKERDYYRIVAKVISNLLGNRIRKDQLRIITFTLFGMCNWIYHWYTPTGIIHSQQLANIINEIFCRGVKNYTMESKIH